jgi:hypothetical protein
MHTGCGKEHMKKDVERITHSVGRSWKEEILGDGHFEILSKRRKYWRCLVLKGDQPG